MGYLVFVGFYNMEQSGNILHKVFSVVLNIGRFKKSTYHCHIDID